MTEKHDDYGMSWGNDHHNGGGHGGGDKTDIDNSFNQSDDDFNLLSGNQVLSGFQLALLGGDNEDNHSGGLHFWS